VDVAPVSPAVRFVELLVTLPPVEKGREGPGTEGGGISIWDPVDCSFLLLVGDFSGLSFSTTDTGVSEITLLSVSSLARPELRRRLLESPSNRSADSSVLERDRFDDVVKGWRGVSWGSCDVVDVVLVERVARRGSVSRNTVSGIVFLCQSSFGNSLASVSSHMILSAFASSQAGFGPGLGPPNGRKWRSMVAFSQSKTAWLCVLVKS